MEKYEIVTAKNTGQELENEKHAGVAIHKEEEGFYKIHLNILPNVTYFMQRNKKNGLFTIYSRLIKSGSERKLQNPVGKALILKDLRTHMMMKFEVLGTHLYMSLFPQN